ncbi:MAG: LD-carboxypeptidase [Bacteroidota bacterium]|nr:LD-carboxypeptidase [Bacteroidota bacterium]
MSSSENNRRSFLKKTALAAAALMAANVNAKALRKFEFAEEEKLILPPRLKSGSTIALTAPAGAIFNQETIQKATLAFETQGFRVVHGETLKQQFGYLAGTDEFRANELTRFFSDKSVDAIIAMRGGWGCARLFNFLDFNVIAQNPKIICGFSDISALLLAIYKKTGLITFHGPVGNSTLEGFTMENFLRIVKDGEALKMMQPSSDSLQIFSNGKATGKLFGGNLTVWCSLIGTGYLPDTTGSLLFFEETEEEPYQVDRMLTQLEIMGALSSSAGIIFGKCTKCDPEEPQKSFTLEEVYRQKFGKLAVPVAAGFNFGHVKDKFTFPVGMNATFDTADSSVKILQSCVI